ncbi:asparaginase [Allobranchiibius sp. GilTou38]|uniref:asparaginase n=1 Tax=Allobranchiibius sp. GilTou38 TaxID=2815210 RepID=UPI001AA19890|nr:asparaginase [Allobranchiibius sp. GilTou38]
MSSVEALSGAPVVAHVVRNGFVESVHHGCAVLTAPDGAVVRQIGDAGAPCFPRSSNKPLQAVAMLKAGLQLNAPLLALASASHSGEAFHLDGVRHILAEHDFSPEDLQNTPDLPYDVQARNDWLAAGHGPTSLAQNCSGKHAGMLGACRAAGWDPSTYLDPAHPLQQSMEQTISEIAGEQVSATAVDGCGAPVMAISLAGLARAFGRIAAADEATYEGRVAHAIRAHPEYLGGTRRDVTALIRAVPGAVAKDGAEAVYAVGLPDGRGFAVKIADGSQRARQVVMAALLRSAGVDSAGLDEIADVPVLGHGQPVGAVLPVAI